MSTHETANALAQFVAVLRETPPPLLRLMPMLDGMAEGAAALGARGADVAEDAVALKSAALAFVNAASTLAASTDALRAQISAV